MKKMTSKKICCAVFLFLSNTFVLAQTPNDVNMNLAIESCKDTYPAILLETTGGGQSFTDNFQLTAAFYGHITTERGLVSGGRNVVKICPGTILRFEILSETGTTYCTINGTQIMIVGDLALGDKLICTNKPEGNDTDRYTIKSGI